jgi:hypothetical protein
VLRQGSPCGHNIAGSDRSDDIRARRSGAWSRTQHLWVVFTLPTTHFVQYSILFHLSLVEIGSSPRAHDDVRVKLPDRQHCLAHASQRLLFFHIQDTTDVTVHKQFTLFSIL